MSYNNFSYFNGPSTPTQWWAPNNPNKPAFEQNRVQTMVKPPITNPWSKTIMTSDYNNQTFTQAPVQGYAQSMILPSENRPAEPIVPHHEVKQGTVTQLFANFGYIEDSIIFSKSDVMGQMVQVGDKVAVDVTYQPNNPTKYKGERVYKVDEARFNSVVHSNSGKMKTLSQGATTRIEIPLRSRTDNKYDTHDLSPRIETSIKSRLDYKYDNRDLSPRMDSSIKNRLDYKYDTRELSPRLDTSIKSRLDYKYDNRELSPPTDSSIKNRLDYKYENQRLSPRIEGPIKSRLESKYESSTRSNRSSSSSKKTDIKSSKHTSIKDRLTITKAKPRQVSSIADKQKEAKRIVISRKVESVKRKVISPIQFQLSPNEAVSGKRKSESESKSKPIKSYETFSNRELDCAAVKNLYRSITLPKEFFHISLKYQNSFPLNHPMKLGNNCHFKVLDKKVKSIDHFIDAKLRKEIDPKDADSTFVAKVMLLSTDDLAKFYKDTLTLAEEFEGENKIAITKAIKFLVSSVGPGKEFAIGGAWSPSLDGPDPDTNPRVLINTAIRTCKAMTGVDLSNCSAWPKFLELHYYRPTQKLQKKNDSIINNKDTAIDVDINEEATEYSEPRMETVVYYIPDVWNCVPSTDSWKEITRLYQEQLTCIMCPPPVIIKPTTTTTTSTIQSTTVTSTVDQTLTTATNNSSSKDNNTGNSANQEEKYTDSGDQEEEDWNFNETEEVDDKAKNSGLATTDGELPTHFSKLIIAGMKIVDIKKELELRMLNSRGVMEQLKARLTAALDREESEEKNKDSPSVVIPVSVVTRVPKIILTEEQKSELKKLYTLPDRPEVIVHQNRKVFDNQMKVRTMSLHSLLSYHNATLPENTFELAIFAKQFLEMLRRDAVFNIYKSIVVADEADLSNTEDSAKKAKLMVTTSKRTVNRPLLFSCTLLDKEKTNKISLEDLKIFIEGLGICLSSDQLASVLAKVKDSSKYLNYRQLTDKEMTDTEIANLLNLDVNEDLDYIKELAMGNKALFDSEVSTMDSLMNEDEMERLKNELDKSERCRQSIELKVASMKDETEKNINLVQIYVKEIIKLKEQAVEYRTKYHSEQDRSEFYKRDFERILRYMKDVDKMSLNLNKFVADSLQKYTVEAKKGIKDETSLTATDSKNKSEKNTDKSIDEEEPTLDIMEEENHVSIETSNDADMPEIPDVVDETDPITDVKEAIVEEVRSVVKVPTIAVHSTMEDFDLSKPSDYDMIIIDETE